jgi:hypothetical protein
VEQALAMPNLGTPQGRSTIVGLHGGIDYVCSARMGFLPEIVPCWSTRAAALPNLLLMVPMLLLAWRAVRGTRYQPGEEPGDLVHAWALAAAAAWWVVAVAVAFSLHLPSRYPQRTLSILEFLAIGQLLCMLLDRRLTGGRNRISTAAIAGGIGLFLLVSFATPTPGLSQPSDKAAMDRLAAMPAGTVVGGVSDQLDYVPALTGQPTLATIEHSIPYHSGYFTPLHQRLQDALAAVASPNPQALADYVRNYRVDVIAVDRALFDYGQLPVRWASVVPDALKDAQELLGHAPSPLQQRAGGCVIHNGALVLLDAQCLTRM